MASAIIPFLYVLLYVNLIEGCDPNYCCCPDRQVATTTIGSTFYITFKAESGFGCSVSEVASSCRFSGGNCRGSSFVLSKSGSVVTVTVDDSRCNMGLRCISSGCRGTDVWDGVYETGNSAAVALSVHVVSLLIAVITGILL
jgi:hypothetical protein